MQAQVHTETLDVTDLKAVQGFAERLPKGFNDIDILVRLQRSAAQRLHPQR